MNNVKWYFSNNTMASEDLVDQFTDSKFGIDRWNSFAREIIQNSLDALDDPTKPVVVKFDLNKSLKLHDIPGGEYTRYVLEKCYESAKNHQTKRAYKKGLDTLNSEYVYCMKISDYNTIGVKTGRDEAWGALVFDEGKSVKQRPGSAGSHGVGKKAPFIISNVNTVFYATKNKYNDDYGSHSECLMQGKTHLINWYDKNGVSKVPKGWFGIIQPNPKTPRDAIKPLTEAEFNGINEYFTRVDECGTDVIIVGVNAYKDEAGMINNMLNAILENFYVAILQNKLEVNLFGLCINKNTFWSILDQKYSSTKDTKNSLISSLEAFNNDAEVVTIYNQRKEKVGQINVHFTLGSENNRKYYSIVRSHGMKIEDSRINTAEQAYSAVVITYGEKLNDLLASLENAAHDSFITKDETIDIDKEAVYVYNAIRSIVKDIIIQKTHIEVEKEQDFVGVDDILMIPGQLSSAKKAESKKKVKNKPVKKKGKGSPSETYGGHGGHADGPNRRKSSGGGKGPMGFGAEHFATLYDDFDKEPFFFYKEKEYSCMFSTKHNLSDASMMLFSINADGKADDTIRDSILSATIDGKLCNIDNGVIKNLTIEKEMEHNVKIKVSKDCTYRLRVDVYGKEMGGDNIE